MKPIILKRQNGLALIMLVLMLMAVGGFVLVGYGQGLLEAVEVKKFKHNTRVLKEAKQALLQFAYNYPVTNSNGPGRLPCADIDNDGDANNTFGDCITLGRLPWNEPNLYLYDIRDADGQRLWYAVSDAFATNVGGGNIINSDTTGTITVRDQSGNVIYDGSANGVAAVIIAPGDITERNGVSQDRSIANADDPFDTTVDTDPGIILASSYLDLVFGTEDNADFTQDSAVDGFILGPVDDPGIGVNVVNDQMIVITAAEVIEVAEKATSQAYGNVIDNYQQTLWGGTVANYRYPWMNAYTNIADLNIYDVVPGTTVGRIPYLNYYVDHDSHVVITDLLIDYDFDWNLTDTADGNDPTYIDAFSAFFGGTQTLDITRSNLSFEKKNFDGSVNNTTDNIGTLITRIDVSTVVNSSNSSTETLYFWDGTGAPLPEDGWEFCPVNSGDETDCARNLAGTAFVSFNPVPLPGWVNHADIKIRVVTLQWTLDAEFEIEFDYSILPSSFAYTAPTGAANARFTTTHNPASVTNGAIDTDSSVNDNIDFIDVAWTFCEQDNRVGTEFNIFALGNDDSNSAYCTPTLNTSVVVNQFDIIADYYPELPLWVSQNNWNDSIMMSYADSYQPGGAGTCTPEDGDTATGAADDCIVVNNQGGTNNNIAALLVIAGEYDFLDGDDLNDDGDFVDVNEVPPDNDFSNDLHDVFETENYSGIGPYPFPNNDPNPASDTGLRLVFDKREDTVNGNALDFLFIIN